MSKLKWLIILLFFSLPLRAQNLLPNPGFELFTECPDNVSQSYRCIAWGEYAYGSPDYYNCTFYSFPGFSNVLGVPAAGNGVMGFIGGDNAQSAGQILIEQITGKLQQDIVQGKTYRLQFDLNITMALPTEQLPIEGKVDFGFHFYNEGEQLSYIQLNNTQPYLMCNAFSPTLSFPMKAVGEYKKYKHFDTCFVADRDYNKVLIGTFCNAETLNFPYSFYYFSLDNIKLEEVNTDPQINIISDLGCVHNGLQIKHNINQQNGLISWIAEGSNIPKADSIPAYITYATPGEYHISVSYYQGCKTHHYLHTVTINNPIHFAIKDTALCPDANIVLDMNYLNANGYLWDNGSTDPVRTFQQKGNYWLQVQNGCQTVDSFVMGKHTQCREDVFLPNSFTPNGDGVNDVFKAYSAYLLSDFELRIFNRWGKQVFLAQDINYGWNGLESDVGTYYYTITYKDLRGNSFFRKGSIQLLR